MEFEAYTLEDKLPIYNKQATQFLIGIKNRAANKQLKKRFN